MRRHRSYHTALALVPPCAAVAVWLDIVPKAHALNEFPPPSFRFARSGLRPEARDTPPAKILRLSVLEPELFAALGNSGEIQRTSGTSAQPMLQVKEAPSGTDAADPVDGGRPVNKDETPEPRIREAADAPIVDPRRRFYGAVQPGEISAHPGTLFGEEQATRFSEAATTKKFGVRFRVGASLVAVDNVNASTFNRKSDLILSVAPTVLIQLGSGESDLAVTAIYTPAGVFFLEHSSQNSFDQVGSIQAKYHISRLTLGLHLSVSSVNGSTLDVGDRVTRNSYYAGLTSDYAISDKTSVELNADYSLSEYSGLLGSQGTRVACFLNYLIDPKLKVGIGGALGFLDVDAGSAQTSQQWLVHAVFSPTPKTSINVSAGGEFRQISGSPDRGPDPVFSVGAAWMPREKLTVTIDARRRTYGSAALTGQNYEATGVAAGVTGNLTRALTVSLAVGYEHDEYRSAMTGVVATRRDDYWNIRPGLDWRISPQFGVGLFYEFSTNQSSGEGSRTFDRNQTGLTASYSF